MPALTPTHYTLSRYGKWGWKFTSPLGTHHLPFPREIADRKLAEIQERHRAKSLEEGPVAEVCREWFELNPN